MNLDVIIPVGPGHEQTFNRAVDSVGMAVDFAGHINARIIRVDDTQGMLGRSLARNHGVSRAEADWLFFLDADDLMHPEALANVTNNFDHDAIFGLTTELVDGNILTRYQAPCIDSYEELIGYDPFLSIKMGHFVKREVAEQLPFNLDMDCGEDWEYYLRLWKQFACVKINKPFFIKCKGQHSTGPKSATGAQWNVAVNTLLEKARGSV